MRAVRDPIAVVGIAYLLLIAAVALLAPVLAPVAPDAIVDRPLRPAGETTLLGTEDVGRDLLSRLIHASRISLAVGVGAALLTVTIGACIGGLAGYYGGRLDAGLSGLVNVMLSMPTLPLALVIRAFNFPSNPTGGVATRAQLESIAEVILAKAPADARVYADEIYENIPFDGNRHFSIASLPGMAARTIIASGASKSYSWTGGRVGWAVLPTAEEALMFKTLNINYFSCISAYNQLGAKLAIESPESPPVMERMVRAFQERRDNVVGALNSIDLRRAAKLCNAKDSEYNKALEILQADFKILPVGVAEAGAWEYSHIYEIVPRHFPDLPEQARRISEGAARTKLLELYFEYKSQNYPDIHLNLTFVSTYQHERFHW